MKILLARLKHWLALFYGVIMLLMVVLFFLNYNGAWMRLLAEKLQNYLN